MSNQQQSPNTAKKLTSSFSSPDSFLQSDTSHHEQNIPTDVSITSSIDATTTNNVVTTSMTTSSLSTAANTTTGTIKLNETRDSGFSDSIIEDPFIKSNKTLRTEHGIEVKNSDISLSTNVYANKGTLKSVEEDINIIQPNQQQNITSNKLEELQSNLDENGKDYITIVKTTKVTTKVKHVNNKKNKKKNKKASASASTQETANNVELQTTTEPADVTVKTTTTIASQVSTATLLITSDNGKIENLLVEESNNIAEECSDSSSNSKEKIEICQNKSTEELVYETTEVKENITLSETIQQPNLIVDLNSTVLDSEDILSTYSNNNANTNLVPQQSPRHVEKTDNVLKDVTESVLNQDAEVKQETQISKEKSKSKEEPEKKTKKSRFNLFFKSKSKKNKKEDSNLATPESPSKKQKIEITNNETNDTTAITNTSPSPAVATQHVLLDQDQKDRILYLKPQCADLLLNEFLKYEKNEKSKTNTKTQLSYLKENDYKLKIILDKMILRSLDLLGHDRIESFDKLTIQLKDEYNIVNLENNNTKSLNKIKKVYLSNIDNKTCELVFNNLLKKSLIEDKILLQLKLDKTSLKPFVELIEFDQSKLENVKTNDNNTFKINETLIEQIRLDNIDKIESEKDHNDVEFIIEEEKNPQQKLPQVQQSSSQSNSNCGTTPPPTPQNELTSNLTDKVTKNLEKSSDDENTKVNLDKVNELLENQNNEDSEIKTVKNINDGARIVLDTVKEPPIRFPSDDDNFQKPSIGLQNVQETLPDPNVILKSNDQTEESKKTKSKSKKSAFSCLSCTGNKLENEQETLPSNLDKKKKEKKSKKSKKTSETKEQDAAVTQNPIVEPLISQEKTVNPELFSNLDSKPTDQDVNLEEKKELDQIITDDIKQEPEEFKEETLQDVKIDLENLEKKDEPKVEETAQLDLKDETPVNTNNVEEVEVKQNFETQEEKKEESKTDSKKGKKDKKKNKKTKKTDSEEKQEQFEEITQNQPIIEKTANVEENAVIEDKKDKKKQKNKKEKAKAQNSEDKQTNDVEIKIEKDDKNDEFSDKNIINETQKLDVNLTQVDSIQVETKSIKNLETNEFIEISQTIVNKTESTTIIDNSTTLIQQPSELNIDTEIKIEKEDQNNPEEVQVEIKKEEVNSNVKTKESKKKIKKEKSKTKNDDEPAVSCFSCKSRKAKKSKKDNLEEKTEVETKQDKEPVETLHMDQKVVDSNLFIGLDPMPSVDTNEKDNLDDNKDVEVLELGSTKDVINDSKDLPIIEKSPETEILEISPEIKQESNNVNVEESIEPNPLEKNETNGQNTNEKELETEIQKSEETRSDEKSYKLEISEVNIDDAQKVEIISTNKQVEESNLVVNVNEQKKLSDDIVVLPDPNERIEVKIASNQEQSNKNEDDKLKSNKDKKAKKSSSFSCFSTKKSKQKENIDKSKAPQTKKQKNKKNKDNKKEDLKLDSEQTQAPQVLITEVTTEINNNTDQTISVQKPSENWAVGLDRNENEPILNKDPIVKEDTAIVETSEKAEEINEKEEIKPSETNNEVKEPIKESEETIELQTEPLKEKLQDFEIKTEATENITSKTESDLLSGAFIKIDREPDHAVVPIVTQDRSNQIKIDENKETVEIENKQDQLKSKKTKTKNKTSLIDLPLINILQPSKVKKSKKSNAKASEEKKIPEEHFTAADDSKNNLDTPIINLNSIKLDQPYKANEEGIKDKKELIETQTEEILTTTIIVESTYNETNLIEETLANNQEDTHKQEEESPNEELKENKYQNEEKFENEAQQLLEVQEQEFKPDLKGEEEVQPKEKNQELQTEEVIDNQNSGAYIVIDRLPDIVVLPDIDLSSRTNYQKAEEKIILTEAEQVKNDTNKVKKSKAKKDKKQKTSFIDLPLINILRPKEAKAENIEPVLKDDKKIENEVEIRVEEVENIKVDEIKETQDENDKNEAVDSSIKDTELPIVELKIEEKKEEEKADELIVTENIQESTQDVVETVVEPLKESSKEDQQKEVLPISEHKQDVSKTKKPNPIDLPLINILKPKEKKSSKEKISCFSCRSRKLKEKKSDQKAEIPTESIKHEEVGVTDNSNQQVINLNDGDVKLDAPYKIELEVPKAEDQNPVLDADILKQKLEILETEINKTTVVKIENNDIAEIVKESKVEEANQTLEESSKTFEKESLKPEVKEEEKITTEDDIENKENQDRNEEQIENNEVSTSVEIIKIEQSTTLENDDFTQTVKQETTIVIEDKPVEPKIEIEPIIIKKNIEIIEFSKPDEVNIHVKKEDIPPEALPVIAELKKSKKKEKKEKIKTKKVKDEDAAVSCFSCKSRKAKAKKDDLNKEQTVEQNKDTPLVESPLALDDSNKLELRPEIKVDSNLFKGLDPVPSVGDAEHIVNHQTFLDNNSTLDSVKNEIHEQHEQYEESEKSEQSVVKEILINQHEENKTISEEPAKNVDTEEKLESENDKKEEDILKSNVEETENILTQEQEIKKDLEETNKPDIIVLSNQPDIVILPDPNQREINPISLNISAEPEKAVDEKTNVKKDKKKKDKIKSTKPKASCFACKSKKSKKTDAKQKEPTEKEIQDVDTNKNLQEQPINITVTPAEEIESQIKPSGQPPKKPPRGHLDESFINNEIISTLNNESSEYNENLSEIRETESKIVEIKENVIEEFFQESKKENIETVESTTKQENLVEEVIIEVKNEILLEKNEGEAETNKIEIEEIKNLPEISSQPAVQSAKNEKTKENKTKKGLTSIIDLPLIDILTPKGSKDKKSKKSKSKKVAESETESKDIIKIENTEKDLTDSKSKENQAKTEQIKISHEDYFKGLDPVRIRSSEQNEPFKENNTDLEKLPVQNKDETHSIEIQIETDEQVKPVAEELVLEIQETKHEDKPVEPILSIQIPNDLENKIKSDYTYVSPGKVENWSTDPLPSVQIGLHKVDFSKSPDKNEELHTVDETKNLTKESETVNIAPTEEPIKEVKKSEKKDKKNKKDKAKAKKVEEKAQLKETESSEKEISKVPTNYIEEIIDSSVKKYAAEIQKQTDDENEDLVKEFNRDEKKIIKSNKKLMIEYLKTKINCTKKQLIESQQIDDPKLTKLTKESQIKDKISSKLFEKSLNTLSKKDTKNLTYTELNKKLEKEIKKKTPATEELQKSVINLLKLEINSGDLLKVKKKDKKLKSGEQNDETKDKQSSLHTQNTDRLLDSKASSLDKLNDQPGVMKRFPSLTWREANERARILFYKGRVPSIRYNEKRDSFRVSMIQQINTADGKEKTTEVPVYDDDVRRLLNSCGLYWDGESISLLNKSDEIFLKAQQEAFQILKSMSSNFNQNEFLSFSDSGLTSLSSNNKIYSTVTTTTTTTTTSTSKTETFKSTSNTESTVQNTTLIQENSTN